MASFFAAACAKPTADATADASYDVVIGGGHVVDGTGNPWFAGDVAIRGDRIVRVAPSGALANASAKRRIDATGLVVAPGFIDIQGQSDSAFLLGDGRNVSKVTQGITTEILGEGATPAPSNARTLALDSTSDTTMARVDTAWRGTHGFGNWLDAMGHHGISENVGSFVGAATIRMYGKGADTGAPNPAQLDTMRAAVHRAMVDGAFGMASALIYPPGGYAGTDELIAEAKEMAPFHGVYITHMRSEGDHIIDAVSEAFRIGKEGGVPVEIYHLKAAGVRNWPTMAKVIAMIDSARAAGQDVGADMYPWEAGGTALAACLPPWSAAGDSLLQRVANPTTRARIRADLLRTNTPWEGLCQLATPHGVMVVGLKDPADKAYEGLRLDEIATREHKEWPDALMDVVSREKAQAAALFFIAGEKNLELQMSQPWIKFGTDADGSDPDSLKGLTHPRAYGNYPIILGRYVREKHVLTVEDAVRKMTSAVAERLSIPDRGLLKEGDYADVVVFDPKTVAANATYEKPSQISSGIREVFVNGVEVVHDEKHTGAKPGRVIRGPGYAAPPHVDSAQSR
ncbi:MAG TPA: amidohydrolase family protein [Gemmatimonadaceae bacterium]|nr:amidohydrolase family protein [Gemmatimonadaceae bacterium]